MVGRAPRRRDLGSRRARHEGPGGRERGRDGVARARGLPAEGRPDLHRGRRRGGGRRLRPRVALPGASGRGSRRVLDQRGRGRSDRARRQAVLPRLDSREDELAVRAPRSRAKRARVDAVDRGQRARQGREADRAPRRVRAGAAARARGVRALRGRGRCAAGGCEPGARGRASGRSDRRRARRAAPRDDRLADDDRPRRRSGTSFPRSAR